MEYGNKCIFLDVYALSRSGLLTGQAAYTSLNDIHYQEFIIGEGN